MIDSRWGKRETQKTGKHYSKAYSPDERIHDQEGNRTAGISINSDTDRD